MKRTWIVFEIAEPFPVFTTMNGLPNTDPQTAKGPFYAAGSKTYHQPREREYLERCAAYWSNLGWTVSLAEEAR